MENKYKQIILSVIGIVSLLVPMGCTCSNGMVFLDTYGDVIPTYNVTYDLGDTSHWWNNLYVDTIYAGNVYSTNQTVTSNITGAGTATFIPQWTSVSNLGNSPISHLAGDLDFDSHNLVDVGSIDAAGDIHTDQDVNAGNNVNVTNDLDVSDDAAIDGTLVMGDVINMSNHQINNVADPALAQDAVTLAYYNAHLPVAGTGNVTYTQSTTDYLPKWSPAGNLINSTVTSNATYVTVAGGIAPTGNIVMSAGATVDGVDISAMSSSNTTETFLALNEPTGFPNRTDSSWTFYDGAIRTLSVTTGSHYHIWFLGVEHTISTTANITIADTEGIHLIYFDTDDALHEYVNPTEAQLYTAIKDKCTVAFIYWDATNDVGVYVGEERHGTIMDGMTHYNLHNTRGLQYVSGLGLGDFIIGDGSLATHAQFSVATGTLSDEDLGLTVSAIASNVGLPVLYRTGVNGDWRTVTQAGYSVYQNPAGVTNRLMYNQLTGGVWTRTEVGEGDYVLCHVFMTTGKVKQMYAIMGQNTYTTQPSARTGATTEISNLLLGNLPSAEIRPAATIIFQTDKDYANAINARVIEAVLGGDDYVSWLSTDLPRGVVPSDHGSLTGLIDDDHTQYLLVDGTRSMTGNLNMGTTGNITMSAGMTVDGVDVSGLNDNDFLLTLLERQKYTYIDYQYGYSFTLVGTGAVGNSIWRTQVGTGTTANSSALGYSPGAYFTYASGTTTGVNGFGWSKKCAFLFSVIRQSSDAEAVAYVQFKHANTIGALANSGVGLKIVNYQIWTDSYGSAEGNIDTGVTLTSGKPVRVLIVHTPATPKIEWYIDVDGNGFVLKATETTSNNIPQAFNTAVFRNALSIENGATGGVNVLLHQSPIWIMITK